MSLEKIREEYLKLVKEVKDEKVAVANVTEVLNLIING